MTVVIVLMTVHMIDGRTVTINMDHVTQLIEPRKEGHRSRQVVGGVNCVVRLVDGSYVSAVEPCAVIRETIRDATGRKQ